MEGLSLIDVSSEDDLLLCSSPSGGFIGPSSPNEDQVGKDSSQLEVIYGLKGNSPVRISKQMEQVLHVSESPEHKQIKSFKYNLRKSLAWDSAFFTSEGVLDPEELAIVNTTFNKVEASSLSVIPEDTRKSTELTSTLDNDSWALENLEVDLFENVRASIQKSLGNADKASKMARPGTKKAPLKRDIPLLESSEKVEPASRDKKKPNLAFERCSNNQHSQHVIRDTHSTLKFGTEENTRLKTVLKPPRNLSTASLLMVASKEGKATSTSGSTKMGNNNAKAISGDAVPQKTVKHAKISNGGSGTGNARSFLSSKPNSTSSSQSSVRKSSDSTSNASSQMTRKICTSKNVQHLSSGSISSKIPAKTTRTSVITRSTSNPNKLPSSRIKLYSAVSPSSSLDSVASGSSSSASNAPKRASDRADAGSSSSSTSLARPSDNLVNSPCIQHHARKENLTLGSPSESQPPSKASQEECLVSDKSRGDHIRVYNNFTSAGNCSKPSGLRMPTPKIGYFDAEKTKIANVGKFPRSGQQQNLQKATNGANVPNNFLKVTTGVSKISKLKSDKLQFVTSSPKNMVVEGSQAQPAEIDSAPSTESTLAEEPSESAKSYSFSTIEGCHELNSKIVKTVSPTKHGSPQFKTSKLTEAFADKRAHHDLSNLQAQQDDADLHQSSIISTPEKDKARTYDIVRKCSEIGSYADGQSTEKECDSVTITTGKENVFPVENS